MYFNVILKYHLNRNSLPVSEISVIAYLMLSLVAMVDLIDGAHVSSFPVQLLKGLQFSLRSTYDSSIIVAHS